MSAVVQPKNNSTRQKNNNTISEKSYKTQVVVNLDYTNALFSFPLSDAAAPSTGCSNKTHLYEYELVLSVCSSVLGVFLQRFHHHLPLLTILMAATFNMHTQKKALRLS